MHESSFVLEDGWLRITLSTALAMDIRANLLKSIKKYISVEPNIMEVIVHSVEPDTNIHTHDYREFLKQLSMINRASRIAYELMKNGTALLSAQDMEVLYDLKISEDLEWLFSGLNKHRQSWRSVKYDDSDQCIMADRIAKGLQDVFTC